jgi:hypothetical protein
LPGNTEDGRTVCIEMMNRQKRTPVVSVAAGNMAADDPLVPTSPRASRATFLHSLLIPCLFSFCIRKGDEPHMCCLWFNKLHVGPKFISKKFYLDADLDTLNTK